MTTPKFIDEIGAKLSELAASTPARDLEKNVRALMNSTFTRLDLVTREEFEVQREMLVQARLAIDELSRRVATLEAELASRNGQAG